jgi:drug/metabolite transporter (DMT)-like permease
LVLLLAIGVFGFIAQVTLTMGLQRESVSRGSLGLYPQILFAVVAERWIFHAIPSYLSIIGITIILTCALYVAVCHSSPLYSCILIVCSGDKADRLQKQAD